LVCLSLFAIVLAHEFGHALACRQVGGKADQIILWLFGGVAYVSPPQRPGALLWSLAAGPLVNVALIPILTIGLILLGGSPSIDNDESNMYAVFLNNVWLINLGLLIFNMMPVYPLDGGQILRSLLWFAIGRADSLMVASTIGIIGVAGLLGLVVLLFFTSSNPRPAIWLGLMATFILVNCWGGLMHARALSRLAKIPRRNGFACPSCKAAPPLGPVWRCGSCRQSFDTFATGAACPFCGAQYSVTHCFECGEASPISQWQLNPGLPTPGQQ